MSNDSPVGSVLNSAGSVPDKVQLESFRQQKPITAPVQASEVHQRVADLTAKMEKIEDFSVEVAEQSFSVERIKEMIKELESALPSASNSLRFHVDDVLDRPVITVIDDKSGEVVRTLPSDEILRAIHNIDKMRGILFDQDS